MNKLDHLIDECVELRRFYAARRESALTRGERSSAGIEALAVCIRLNALREAKRTILAEAKTGI